MLLILVETKIFQTVKFYFILMIKFFRAMLCKHRYDGNVHLTDKTFQKSVGEIAYAEIIFFKVALRNTPRQYKR